MAELKPGDFGIVSKKTPTPESYGKTDDPQRDLTAGSAPSNNEVANFHRQSDVNSSGNAQHHTLGTKRNQAASGSHTHNGVDSKRVIQTRSVLINFTALASFTQAVTFPDPYPTGTIPFVWTNINSGSGTTARWDSRAISITNVGFTIWVFRQDGADPVQTWVDVPVQWGATT